MRSLRWALISFREDESVESSEVSRMLVRASKSPPPIARTWSASRSSGRTIIRERPYPSRSTSTVAAMPVRIICERAASVRAHKSTSGMAIQTDHRRPVGCVKGCTRTRRSSSALSTEKPVNPSLGPPTSSTRAAIDLNRSSSLDSAVTRVSEARTSGASVELATMPPFSSTM